VHRDRAIGSLTTFSLSSFSSQRMRNILQSRD
jgi:hypothetical protein